MVLEISQNSQENICVRVYFLIKLQAETCNFIKKRIWHRCSPVNFAKFLRGRLHMKFHPRMKSSPCLWWNVLLFTRFCRDEISSRDEKKKKRRVNTSSRDEILKWARNLRVNRIFFIAGQVSSQDEISSRLHVNAL